LGLMLLIENTHEFVSLDLFHRIQTVCGVGRREGRKLQKKAKNRKATGIGRRTGNYIGVVCWH